MSSLDQARDTQLKNIEAKTGRELGQLRTLLAGSGLAKHGELRDAAKSGLGLGHGDANTLVTLHLRATGDGTAPAATADAAVEEIYAGPKAALRPIHDRVMEAIAKLGPFEIAPKKAYLSLRRKKQFAMVGPATKTQVEIGLNAKDLAGRRTAWSPRSRAACASTRCGSPRRTRSTPSSSPGSAPPTTRPAETALRLERAR